MINPNAQYNGKASATIIKIDSLDSYIPYVTVLTDDGRTLEGSLTRCYSKPQNLKVGQRVTYKVQWSIMSDKPMLCNIRRKLK